MDCYAVQVKTGKEAELLEKIGRLNHGNQEICVYFPRRILYIKKGGIEKKVEAPVFPSYIFLAFNNLSIPLRLRIHKMAYIYRFLPNNQNPVPLSGSDLAILRHFLSFGTVAAPSQVYFNNDMRICVVSGVLKGLEGNIIKVDKRKRRAKVRLDMCTDSFTVDLAFDVIERSCADEERRED